MLVIFDNGAPRTLARFLIGRHTVTEARARGWEELENGELLNQAEAAGFQVMVTTDKNMRYQQNFAGRKIAVVVLGQGRWTLEALSILVNQIFQRSIAGRLLERNIYENNRRSFCMFKKGLNRGMKFRVVGFRSRHFLR
jgi:predicted nuclease of predicted toxin-antitoxin system